MENLKQCFGKWCVWRKGKLRDNGKPSKEPINPKSGSPAQSNKPETFGTFEQALRALRRDKQGRYAGLGVLMSSGTGVVCIDIDDCLSSSAVPNEIAAWALANFRGFCEASQSGKGLHFFMQAITPTGCREKVTVDGCSLEIYSNSSTRYIAVTGNKYPDERREAGVIAEQDALERFAGRFGFLPTAVESVASRNTDTNNATAPADEETHSDEEILKLLKQRNRRGKITRLFDGDLSDYSDNHSGADQALCNFIAYYTTDPAQIKRIFDTSGLSKREKWQRADYRKRTIGKALDDRKEYYFDKISKKDNGASAETAEDYAGRLIGGTEGLVLAKSGKPASTVYNAIQVLLRDHRTQGAVGYNQFGGKVEVLRPLRDVFGVPAPGAVGDMVDDDITTIRVWLFKEHRINLSKDDAFAAVTQWARHGEFNPVTEALDRCEASYDGVHRLGTWLQDYLNVEPGEAGAYVSEVGRRFLISAVARAYAPGCKADGVLVLEGKQGTHKSQAARALCESVYPAGFLEDLPLIGGGEETARALRGMWIVELPELAAMQKGNVATEHVKAFFSRQQDNGRAPYDRVRVNWKRTTVFIATTNEGEYISDPTGGRRFWSVKVAGNIDIERLRKDAPNLFGEAVRAFKSGEPWHITDAAIIREAAEQQQERQAPDVWRDAVIAWLLANPDGSVSFPLEFSMQQVFTDVFREQMTLAERAVADQRRFGALLRQVGFNKRKTHGIMRWSIDQRRINELRAGEHRSD